MEKVLIFSFSFLILAFGYSVNAQDIETKVNFFKKIENTNFILLNIGIKDSSLTEEISYWKVRGYCEDNVNIYFPSNIDCNKSFKIMNSTDNSLFFLLDNSNEVNRFNLTAVWSGQTYIKS